MNTATDCLPALDWGRVRAITLDLDDTLWPIWPTLHTAEHILQTWLLQHAPRTAALPASARQALREQLLRDRPELAHDFSAIRRESMRLWLEQSGEDPALAEPAFELFFAARQDVTLFDDALPFLRTLAARLPVVALSNGNADVHRIGIGEHFHAALSARSFGALKPDPGIFRAAAEAAGVAPEQVLHIGDDVALDIIPALQLGMQAVWINREGAAWPQDPPAPLRPQGIVASLDAVRLSWLGASLSLR